MCAGVCVVALCIKCVEALVDVGLCVCRLETHIVYHAGPPATRNLQSRAVLDSCSLHIGLNLSLSLLGGTLGLARKLLGLALRLASDLLGGTGSFVVGLSSLARHCLGSLCCWTD